MPTLSPRGSMPIIRARHLVIVALCAVAGLLVGGTAAYFLFVATRAPDEIAAAEPPPEPEPPPKPSLTEGFQLGSPRSSSPPIDPMRDPPRPGEDPEPVLTVTEEVDPDIGVGIGRAAVIHLEVRPTAFRITPYLDVTPMPPYLVLSAARGGLFTLTVEHEGGEQEWIVSVHGTSLADPEGERIVAESERLGLDVGATAICTLDAPTNTLVVVDPSIVTVTALDDRTLVIGPEATGVVDLVLERRGRAPRVLTVDASGEEGAAKTVPAGCTTAPGNAVELPLNGEMSVPVGLVASAIHVGDEEIVSVQRADDQPNNVVLRAISRGSTTVAVSDGRGGAWLRKVVVQ